MKDQENIWKDITKAVNENDILNVLESCSLFSDFSKETLDKIIPYCNVKKLNRNATFFTINQEARYFCILAKGRLLLTLKDGRQKEIKPYTSFGEIALLTEDGRTGTITALEESKLIVIQPAIVNGDSSLPLEVSLSIVRRMASRIVSYLASSSHHIMSTSYLIQKGEGERIEFKESFSQIVKPKIYETIVAFMNTEGGTIIVGVKDDKKILGIKNKGYKDDDVLQLNIINTINSNLGAYFASLVKIDFEKVAGKKIMRIDCEKSNQPAFINKNGEHFYIRQGPSNLELTRMDLFHHLKNKGF